MSRLSCVLAAGNSIWLPARQSQGSAWIADWLIAGWSLSTSRFRTFGPPQSPLSSADSASTRTTVQNAPLGSFGD
eukprot:15069-Alexandrium_andersonii.AAC.2